MLALKNVCYCHHMVSCMPTSARRTFRQAEILSTASRRDSGVSAGPGVRLERQPGRTLELGNDLFQARRGKSCLAPAPQCSAPGWFHPAALCSVLYIR